MLNANSAVKPSHFNIYAGTFLIAFSTLAIEITLTRIFSVITFYHLAFFAISTVMLGMTAGATTVYFKPMWFKEENIASNTAKACLAYAASAGIALIILCSVPAYFTYSIMSIISLLILTTACSLPFYFAGMVISIVLTKYPQPIGKLYASDLVGASMGCLFVLGGLEIFDAPGLILLSGAVGIIPVFCFGSRVLPSRIKTLSIFVLIMLLSGVTINLLTLRGIRPMFVKGGAEHPKNHDIEEWNSFSRVVVLNGFETIPRTWGASPEMPKDYKSYIHKMNIDGEATTWLTRYNSLKDIEYLKFDITNAGYYLRENAESSCIIGVGGGRDIHSALLFGSKKITGIDVNPVFIDLIQNKFRNEANIANNPNVKLVVDEARSYLTGNDEKFSVIQMSLIDTWASTGAGAYTLTENSLYTTEAWKVFYSRLDSNGIYTLSRWYNPVNIGETGRVISLAVATLLESGVTEPSKHIAMLTINNLSTLIISRRPFIESEIDKLKIISDSLKYNLTISPEKLPEFEILRKIVSSKSIEELNLVIKDEPLNYAPPTDDNPYFFNMLKLDHIGSLSTPEPGVMSGNLTASMTLIIMIISLLVLSIITIIIPLIYGSRIKSGIKTNRKIFWQGAVYFSFIGAGFMMTEIGLMQRLSVFLGHPVYALGILLFTIILSTGIGSFFSEKYPATSGPWKYILPAIAASAIIALNFILNNVISIYITSPMMIKIIISVAMIFPLGFVLGFFFPAGIKYVKSSSPGETPWFWALNGIFGVLFSAMAVFFSIYFGISTNFYLAAICYAGLLTVIKGLSSQKEVINN
jgi:hypothetical protein